MEKIIKKIFVFIVILCLFIFSIGTLLNNEKISEVERRELKTYPKITFKNILKKSFYDDLTSAFSDQLFLRGPLVKGYFLFNFQNFLGDAVVGSNKQLYSAPQDKEESTYYTDLDYVINTINNEDFGAQFIFLSIPRKDAYMTKDLPKTYNSSLESYQKASNIIKENLNENIIYIDALDIFNKSGIYECYYSNDHHITPKCAYELYKEINKYTQTNSYDLDDVFSIKQTVVNGAYNRQLGQSIKSEPEDLYLELKDKSISWTRYENNKISNKKVYGSGNTYEDAYMEGDNAYTRIITNINNNKKIMFVGSSYTNILEALSVPSYKEVVSIDYRHNKTNKSIKDYVEENSIDYIVYIPAQSTNSFSTYSMLEHLGK